VSPAKPPALLHDDAALLRFMDDGGAAAGFGGLGLVQGAERPGCGPAGHGGLCFGCAGLVPA
jgi:hypothetical protein